MAYEVRRFPDESIVLITFTNPFDPANDIAQSSAQAETLSQDIHGKAYRIVDASSLEITFNSLVEGLYQATRNAVPSPDIHAVLVGSSAMVVLAGKAMGQKQYGALNIPVFASLDEALGYTRDDLKK